MTSETKHTPGPWLSRHLCPALYRVCDEEGNTVADAEDAANARLIAAAPDLAAALADLLSYAEGSGWPCLPAARAALAKAGL